jgi:HPt (histidine-containing phosphotransfer) domain-containing protein
VKDKISELPEALYNHLPVFIDNRKNELQGLRCSFENKDQDKILKWTHRVLGVSDSYKLFELTQIVQNMENKLKNNESIEFRKEYEILSSYLVNLSKKITR